MKCLIKNKHWNIVEDCNIDKLLYLLVDRPDKIIISEHVWVNKKDRDYRNYDLPSWIASSGHIYWRKNNLLHRENNKPAIIFNNGNVEYWIDGVYIRDTI